MFSQMHKIRISKKDTRYNAQIEGHPEIWGCGDTPFEAIGALISNHSEIFDIEICFKN